MSTIVSQQSQEALEAVSEIDQWIRSNGPGRSGLSTSVFRDLTAEIASFRRHTNMLVKEISDVERIFRKMEATNHDAVILARIPQLVKEIREVNVSVDAFQGPASALNAEGDSVRASIERHIEQISNKLSELRDQAQEAEIALSEARRGYEKARHEAKTKPVLAFFQETFNTGYNAKHRMKVEKRKQEANMQRYEQKMRQMNTFDASSRACRSLFSRLRHLDDVIVELQNSVTSAEDTFKRATTNLELGKKLKSETAREIMQEKGQEALSSLFNWKTALTQAL